jgi:hypothetical protein
VTILECGLRNRERRMRCGASKRADFLCHRCVKAVSHFLRKSQPALQLLQQIFWKTFVRIIETESMTPSKELSDKVLASSWQSK